MDWSKEANRVVKLTSKDMFEAQRGAIRLPHPAVCAAFGNDGYRYCDQMQSQVRLLNRACEEQGMPRLGFALSDNGYSWVALYSCTNVEWLNTAVWQAWYEAVAGDDGIGQCAGAFVDQQKEIASNVIDRHDPVLQSSDN